MLPVGILLMRGQSICSCRIHSSCRVPYRPCIIVDLVSWKQESSLWPQILAAITLSTEAGFPTTQECKCGGTMFLPFRRVHVIAGGAKNIPFCKNFTICFTFKRIFHATINFCAENFGLVLSIPFLF